MAFYGKPIVYRTTDFKTNEYRNLLGGNLFEDHEDNPMLGYRGVSRDIHNWEIESFKLARSAYGAHNLQLMLPFVRTLEQARAMRGYLDTVHNLRSGEDGLKIILMSELPSNAILARQFIQEFDGFSIGSNDMTQMVLATDRDNSSLSHIYDEEDPAVVWAILVTIFSGQKFGKKVGFCGQGVANSEVLRGLVAISGITSASVVPDTYYRTKQDFAAAEALNISASGLGKWLGEQHQAKLVKLLEAAGKVDVAKLASDPAKIRAWYDAETARLHGELRDSLGGSRENTARKALKAFREAVTEFAVQTGGSASSPSAVSRMEARLPGNIDLSGGFESGFTSLAWCCSPEPTSAAANLGAVVFSGTTEARALIATRRGASAGRRRKLHASGIARGETVVDVRERAVVAVGGQHHLGMEKPSSSMIPTPECRKGGSTRPRRAGARRVSSPRAGLPAKRRAHLKSFRFSVVVIAGYAAIAEHRVSSSDIRYPPRAGVSFEVGGTVHDGLKGHRKQGLILRRGSRPWPFLSHGALSVPISPGMHRLSAA